MNDVHQPQDPQPVLIAPPAEPERHHRLRRIALVIGVLLLLGLLAWVLTPKGTKAPGGRFANGGPMPVVAAQARAGDMPITLIGLGAVTPIATVTVQTQV